MSRTAITQGYITKQSNAQTTEDVSGLVTRAETLLQTYDLSELLDLNDLTEEDLVELLLDQELITFIKPVDYD